MGFLGKRSSRMAAWYKKVAMISEPYFRSSG